MTSYILYKNPIQYDTLYIVQYLHYLGINIIPTCCIERNHPSWVNELPSIETISKEKEKERYVGLNECISFFEKITGIENLYEKSQIFKKLNPEYRIHL